MKIAIIAFAVAICVLGTWIYILSRRIDELMDRLTTVVQNEVEFRKEEKKEVSKIYDFAQENAEAIRKLRKRVKAIGEGTKEMEEKIGKELEALKEKQKDFEDIADESVRAQIDAEKAWAEGVRSIANFGASIPTLNTKVLENE